MMLLLLLLLLLLLPLQAPYQLIFFPKWWHIRKRTWWQGLLPRFLEVGCRHCISRLSWSPRRVQQVRRSCSGRCARICRCVPTHPSDHTLLNQCSKCRWSYCSGHSCTQHPGEGREPVMMSIKNDGLREMGEARGKDNQEEEPKREEEVQYLSIFLI